jgi:hypothetical protein
MVNYEGNERCLIENKCSFIEFEKAKFHGEWQMISNNSYFIRLEVLSSTSKKM